MIKKTCFLIVLFLFSFFETASAHVKWFVDSDEVIKESHNAVPFYYLHSTEVIIWSIISILVVLVFSILDRIIPPPKKLFIFGLKHDRGIDRAVSIVLGLYLVCISLIWNIILIPDIPVASLTTFGLLIVQLTLGILFILGVGIRTASMGVILLLGYMTYRVGLLELGENLLTASIVVYLYIRHSPKRSIIGRLDNHSVEIVRIATGISLIVMAFSEKLMYPELGLSFLQVHHWNFMYNLGLTWYSNELFVLSTGFAEMIFGVIFILGYLTRINTVLIASFFASSVVMMMAQFGQWEVEDLVVYAAATLFIFYGHGKTKFFHFIWPKSMLHTRTIENMFRKTR